MIPIDLISVGDKFRNPNGGYAIFVVIDVNKKEKMIKVQTYSITGRIIGEPFWKKNTAPMFSESWRLL